MTDSIIKLPTPTGEHKLPPLPYGYTALEPVIDAKTLQIHHDRHHKKYVDDLNTTEKATQSARQQSDMKYIKYLENELAFNGSGHILHSIYWTIMTSPGKGGSVRPQTLSYIKSYFGSYDEFKEQFISAANTVEGSGWAVLGWNPAWGRLEILQCEKHQNLTQWSIIPILVCDVWEHAYYLKYQNQRSDFINSWYTLINWSEVEKRLILAQKGQIMLWENTM